MGGLEKIDVAASIWQVFLPPPQHPSHSHPFLTLDLISKHPCLFSSHTFCSFVLSDPCPTSLLPSLTIRA